MGRERLPAVRRIRAGQILVRRLRYEDPYYFYRTFRKSWAIPHRPPPPGQRVKQNPLNRLDGTSKVVVDVEILAEHPVRQEFQGWTP